MFFVTLLNQFYWFFGSTLGGVLGSFIHFNTEGLDFVLTALFVVIFLEQWLKDKDHTSSILGIVLSLLCLIAFGADDFMIPSMIAIDPKVYPVSWKSSPCCSVWTADRLLLKKCKYLFWQPRNP